MTGPISQLDATIRGDMIGAGGGPGAPGASGTVGAGGEGKLDEAPPLPPQLPALSVNERVIPAMHSLMKEAGPLKKLLTRKRYYSYAGENSPISFVLTRTSLFYVKV